MRRHDDAIERRTRAEPRQHDDEKGERRQALTEIVRGIAPDHEICNETEVAEFPETTGAEEIP